MSFCFFQPPLLSGFWVFSWGVFVFPPLSPGFFLLPTPYVFFHVSSLGSRLPNPFDVTTPPRAVFISRFGPFVDPENNRGLNFIRYPLFCWVVWSFCFAFSFLFAFFFFFFTTCFLFFSLLPQLFYWRFLEKGFHNDFPFFSR